MQLRRLRSKEDVGGGEATAPGAEQPDPEATEGRSEMARVVARYREMAASLPGVVAELVVGETIEEVDASVEGSRRAYEMISRRMAEEQEATIPVGNPARSASEAGAGSLKPEAKIALGLRRLQA